MKAHLPSLSLSAAFVALLFPTVSLAQTVYPLRPYQQKPGEVIKIVTNSTSAEGTMSVTENGETSTVGKLSVRRDRHLERRVVREGLQTQLHYKVVSDTTRTTIKIAGEGEPQTLVSPLSGKTLIGVRDAAGKWRFSLPGATEELQQLEELEQFDAYENHSLLPNRAVRLKESWEIHPNFLKHLTERGIGEANVQARARLDQIKEIDGEPTAIITLTVETVATDGSAAEGGGVGASIRASGELHVTLATGFDKKLVLYGNLTTVAVDSAAGTRTRTQLPMRIEVDKTLQR